MTALANSPTTSSPSISAAQAAEIVTAAYLLEIRTR